MGGKRLVTADEFERMPDEEAFRTELDEGKVVRREFATLSQGAVTTEIAYAAGTYVKQHRLGVVVCGNCGFRLGDDTVRAPSVGFVRQGRVDAVRSKGFARGAPDLAVEIFSPSDSVAQLMRKVKQYLAAGCHTVWIVYPETQEVHVLEATGADRLLRGEDVLEAPELLPGFAVRVADFFETDL